MLAKHSLLIALCRPQASIAPRRHRLPPPPLSAPQQNPSECLAKWTWGAGQYVFQTRTGELLALSASLCTPYTHTLGFWVF